MKAQGAREYHVSWLSGVGNLHSLRNYVLKSVFCWGRRTPLAEKIGTIQHITLQALVSEDNPKELRFRSRGSSGLRFAVGGILQILHTGHATQTDLL